MSTAWSPGEMGLPNANRLTSTLVPSERFRKSELNLTAAMVAVLPGSLANTAVGRAVARIQRAARAREARGFRVRIVIALSLPVLASHCGRQIHRRHSPR